MPYLQYARVALICLPMLYMSSYAWAEDQWLLVAQGEAINVGQSLSFKVIKPNNVAEWPANMHIKLSGVGNSDEIELTARESNEANQISREYSGTPRQPFVGVVRAALVEQPSNTVLLLANNETVIATEAGDTTQSIATENVAPQVVIAAPDDEPALTAEEPVYFLFGHGHEHGWDARFQISFKYRPFEPKGSVAQFAPFLSNLYFSYSQTTLWDIGSDSSPFRDTSYRPGLFYRWVGNTNGGWLPDHWRIGIEHESNGQGGNESRSLNTAYLRPSWQINFASGRKLVFSPKIYTYLDKDENPDIQHYRGYADWQLRYGREDGLMLTGLYRQGTRGYATGQLDITYPLSDRILSRTGTFAHLQLFSGYGETLLDYNRDRDTQIRLGISVTR